MPDLQKKLQDAVKGLANAVATEAVNWSIENFNRQGFPGESFQPWPPRKSGARRNQGKSILVQTGRLRRGNRVISAGDLSAVIGNDVPYARAHNYGFNGTVNVPAHSRNVFTHSRQTYTTKTGKQRSKKVSTISGTVQVRAYQRRMSLPQRQFMGTSPVLISILIKRAKIHLAQKLK